MISFVVLVSLNNDSLLEQVLKPVIKTIVSDDLKYKTLQTYSFWEANKKIVRVEVPLPGVHTINKENIISKFEETTLEIKINNLNGLHYLFAVPRLHASVIPNECDVTVKVDKLSIKLRKAKEEDNWSFLYKFKFVGEK